MKLLRKFSKKKLMGDGPQVVATSTSTSTDGSSPYSPLSLVTNGHSDTPNSAGLDADGNGASDRQPRSSSSGSLPSPAMVTNEARQVLEAFLQRTQSMDRGSTGSMGALVPRHLEVIEEIRHTRGRRSDSDHCSMDGIVVEAHVPVGSDTQIDSMEVQHTEGRNGHHETDIALHIHSSDDMPGLQRVVRTHLTHPAAGDFSSLPPHSSRSTCAAALATGACAAKVVTQNSNEVFIDASLSRQSSVQDEMVGATAARSPLGSHSRGPTPFSPPPSSHAYFADAERPTPTPPLRQVASEAAAEGKAWKKRRKSISRLTRWWRSRGESRKGQEEPDLREDGFEWDRPPFQKMESVSSSTSSTTSSHGAPTRSLVHRDWEAEERRKKRRKERRRQSFKWRQTGGDIEASSGSVFHQLFAALRSGRKRPTVVTAASDPTLDDVPNAAPTGKEFMQLSPSIEEDESPTLKENSRSLPNLHREQETKNVLETFRCIIDKGGCKYHKNGECLKVSNNQEDQADGRILVDQAKLHLDLNSSSNSQSSQGANTASSPEGGLGPDGVAPKKQVDRVARMLDEMAKVINSQIKEGNQRSRERRKSAPNIPRFDRDSQSHERASSTTRDGEETTLGNSSASSRSVYTSQPLLNDETRQAMRAKARRMICQSSEDLVSEDLVAQLADCDTYEHFENLVRRSNILSQSTVWKQITLLYWLARRVVRFVKKRSGSEEREKTIKEFAMQFFSRHFASSVVKRGGWQHLIENTEDSELD